MPPCAMHHSRKSRTMQIVNYGVKTNHGNITIHMYGVGIQLEPGRNSQRRRDKRSLEDGQECNDDMPKRYCRTWHRKGACNHGDKCKRLTQTGKLFDASGFPKVPATVESSAHSSMWTRQRRLLSRATMTMNSLRIQSRMIEP